MQKTNELKKLYKETEKRYRNRHLDFDQKDLCQTIDVLYRESKENYLKLPNPKLCSTKVYTEVWVNNEIGKDIIGKSVGKPFELSNPPLEYKAAADFNISYPPEFVQEMRRKQGELWEMTKFNIMKNKWLKVVEERNNFSLSKGYRSRIEMYLDNFKISKLEYGKFIKNVNKAVNFCNKYISLNQSEFLEEKSDKICFVCRNKNFPFKNTNELFSFFEDKSPLLHKYIDKVKIKAGDFPTTEYIKETDSFEIKLNSNLNVNHQIIDLIHELTHVVTILKRFKNGDSVFKKGLYYREKLAAEMEIYFIKKYFPELLPVILGIVLQIIQQTLFEIEIYNNPKIDPDKLYAKCFNRCFIGAKQKINRFYLLNPNIVNNNFGRLPYAVAYVNVLANKL